MSMIDKFNQWRGKDRRKREVAYVAVTHELSESTQKLIEQLIEVVKDGGSGNAKLDQILQTLLPVADIPLMRQELSTIHGLIADMASADPEKIKQLAASIKATREKLQTSLNNQQEGD